MNSPVRTYILFLCVVFSLLIARLVYIQLVNEQWKEMAEINARKKRIILPDRGYLYDRNQKLIAASKPEFDLQVIPREMKAFDTTHLLHLLDIDLASLKKSIRSAKRYSSYKPSLVYSGITKREHAQMIEFMHNFSGFEFQKRYVRDYLISNGAHILGYLGQVTNSDMRKDDFYSKGDLKGKTGVELAYEHNLRGTKGYEYLTVDVFNRYVDQYAEGKYDKKPIPGKEIQLTIDIELQAYAEKLFQGKRGALVAIEPSSGEILALVSSPTYNPKLLGGKNQSMVISELLDKKIDKPLFDRSTLAEYPPGSIFKPVIGLVSLQYKAITRNFTNHCNHGYTFGRLHVGCHCGTYKESIGITKALYKSCNSFFIQTYLRFLKQYETSAQGINTWNKAISKFGLGRFLNNDLPFGKRGLIPDANYYANFFGHNHWTNTMTLSNGIGQGEVLMTPIQMANITTILANRGWYKIPHIVKTIAGKPIRNSRFNKPHLVGIDSIYFKPVIDGLCQVFNNPQGTAYNSHLADIEICGKTGTSENPHGEDHSLSIAFAPRIKPKIALAVVVENGTWGSKWASPMASLIIERYLTKLIRRKNLDAYITNTAIDYELEKPKNNE